jgi:lysine 2,3-aminomutase
MKTKTLHSLNELINHQLVNKDDELALQKVTENFSIAITEQMFHLIDKQNSDDPIAKQFVPSTLELTIHQKEKSDPIGDKVHTKVKGIVHRYPDRCLFTPVHVCPVYCRFCFRKEKVGHGDETLTPNELEQAFQYIENHPAIWEVILTGGDPLILKPTLLKKIIQRLHTIPHVEVIRIHTRVPVVDSARINAEMIDALNSHQPVYVVLHANHSQEFTPAAIQACANLVNAGIPLLSQTTLLKNINDNVETLSQLMRCFIKHRIKPYYLHHADLVPGTSHFRTSIAQGQQLMRELRGRFSGICQPTYVLDIPGGFGKVPIGPQYLKQLDESASYCVEDYQGQLHVYD